MTNPNANWPGSPFLTNNLNLTKEPPQSEKLNKGTDTIFSASMEHQASFDC